VEVSTGEDGLKLLAIHLSNGEVEGDLDDGIVFRKGYLVNKPFYDPAPEAPRVPGMFTLHFAPLAQSAPGSPILERRFGLSIFWGFSPPD
jgi:hypothetical protein